MTSAPLFRRDAVTARSGQHLGGIVLLRPLTFTLIAATAAGLALAVLAFLFLGEYTQKVTLRGQLVPERGLIAVQSPQAGLVVDVRVKEGQPVRQGDVLFVISGERMTAVSGATQAAISARARSRAATLRDDLEKQGRLQARERETIEQRIADLVREGTELDRQIDAQAQRASALEASTARFEQLRAQGYVSAVQLDEKRDQGLESRSDLYALNRQRLALSRDLDQARADLATWPARSDAALSAIRRDIAAAEQEILSSEAQRELVITASQSGTVTAIAAVAGRSVTPTTPLASIVPEASALEAWLYGPSRAIGFIAPGKPVLLSYEAFPYQKFGRHSGSVRNVSRVTVRDDEAPPGTAPGKPGEPVYRITVALDAQTVRAYGLDQPLKPGMDVTAAVLLERRRLIEWVFEPLFSVSGRL